LFFTKNTRFAFIIQTMSVSNNKGKKTSKEFVHSADEISALNAMVKLNFGSLNRIKAKIFQMYGIDAKSISNSTGAPKPPKANGDGKTAEKSAKSLKKDLVNKLCKQVPGWEEFSKLPHDQRQADKEGTTFYVGIQNIIQCLLKLDVKIEDHQDWGDFCQKAGARTIECKLDSLRDGNLFSDVIPIKRDNASGNNDQTSESVTDVTA
jgi:hypothetical protein